MYYYPGAYKRLRSKARTKNKELLDSITKVAKIEGWATSLCYRAISTSSTVEGYFDSKIDLQKSVKNDKKRAFWDLRIYLRFWAKNGGWREAESAELM